ncbi:hypothetical protein tb265_49070 [Gemmatimonadetes bacterium T265]|nr:hypothetical protein tb265_49070 [Gemmatimonadetes bacterium T265]
MTIPLAIPDLVRPAFFDGQRLEAEDLTAVYEFHRSRRWLHNRALHGWGIASGLAVGGAKGAAVLTVSPGYALDCEGHDVVLAEPAELAVPPVAGAPGGGPLELYLTASYATDDDLAASEVRAGVCEGTGAVRRAEAPRLRFQNPRDPSDPATRFRRGLDVVLASVQVERCRLARAPSTAERRDARPAAQPFVAAGGTAPGATPWQYFPAAGAPLGVETRVDTSAAGFRSTPAYAAQVAGARALPGGGALVDGFAAVAQPSATAFTLQVMLPRDLSAAGRPVNPSSLLATPALLAMLQSQLRWSVSWIGVEG